MFDKLGVLFSLFRVGGEIKDAALAKNIQNLGNAFGALILLAVSAAKWFGLDIKIDDSTALYIGGAAATVFNIVCTTISSRKVGLLPAKPADAVGSANTGSSGGVPSVPAPVAAEPVQPVSSPAPEPYDKLG